MEAPLPIHRAKCLTLFLNISFIFLIICLTLTHLSSPSKSHFLNPQKTNYSKILDSDNIGCKDLHNHHESQSKCSYVKSHKGCQLGSFIPYLQLFYCTFSTNPPLGFTLLILGLVLLFYLLGDTAANYFCSSLEGLSRVLNLSPSIAGVTLLSLGNGAPDLFSSIASFMGDSSGGGESANSGDVGLNSILGGAFFVSSIVVGIISICVCHSRVSVNKSSFIRDVLFFLLSILCLLVIIAIGKINLWGAISFLSLYFVYVFLVSTSELCNSNSSKDRSIGSACSSPMCSTVVLLGPSKPLLSASPELGAPLLGLIIDKSPISSIIDQENHELQVGEPKGIRWCLNNIEFSRFWWWFGKLLCILELPLDLPRRLTIPVISEERWSKPVAVISATLAPIFLAVIWDYYDGPPNTNQLLTVGIGASFGIVLGVFAFFTTEVSGPPRTRKCLFPWLVGGFLMSITWTYILADELVSLLVSLGLVLGISPSILGLTVLAWGNSLGDLVSNLSMARNGGPDGVQVGISGCYAGPIFNIVVGLGLSLVFSSWAVYPSCCVIHTDSTVYETVGFLMGGLLWALVVLPIYNMRLHRFLGVGLLAIYLCFLCLKMARTLGLLQLLHVSLSHFMT
ncbi:hypothetical protein HYC85_016930 [Camellia sinensis]|uniref:Sodium/calcium exchanger membrane region domain-containing protein n=1 Tax=Camellia sinensis TaxID=4442 RepID=A0A7J7H105_CAMSI|nr:hypothetical protein HYC85_016930 [Camellia sinensis]